MVRLIVWDKDAEAQLDSSLHYYMTNFSRNAAQKLYEEIEERLSILTHYPESGRAIKDNPELRYVHIRKTHYLYYGFNEKSLFVVGLYGTKQRDNPYR